MMFKRNQIWANMKILRFPRIVVFAGAALLSGSVAGVEIVQDLDGMTPLTVGAAEEGRAFFNIAEYPAKSRPGGCIYELYYVKLETPGGRAIYATLLNTKNLGKKLIRFDVNRVAESGGVFCYVNLVITQD